MLCYITCLMLRYIACVMLCYLTWVKGAKCVSSDFLNEKVLMILTGILKIKAQLNQLVNWKPLVTLFYPEQSVEF